MKHDNEKCKKCSHGLMILSIVALILAAVVSLSGMEAILGLAGTQWILVAITMAVYAMACSSCMCGCGCGDSCETGDKSGGE